VYVTGGWKVYSQQLFGRTDSAVREPAKAAKAENDKTRFDFYKILPGAEEPKVGRRSRRHPTRGRGQVAGKVPSVVRAGDDARPGRRQGSAGPRGQGPQPLLLQRGRSRWSRTREPQGAPRARRMGRRCSRAGTGQGVATACASTLRQHRRVEPHQGQLARRGSTWRSSAIPSASARPSGHTGLTVHRHDQRASFHRFRACRATVSGDSTMSLSNVARRRAVRSSLPSPCPRSAASRRRRRRCRGAALHRHQEPAASAAARRSGARVLLYGCPHCRLDRARRVAEDDSGRVGFRACPSTMAAKRGRVAKRTPR